MVSAINVRAAIPLIIEGKPLLSGLGKSVSWTAILSLRLGLFPIITINMVEIVMIPRPPAWISMRTTDCPNFERSLPMSRTVRPVTHTADVAVKSASINDMDLPEDETGRMSKKAPIRLATIKLRIMDLSGREIILFPSSVFLS